MSDWLYINPILISTPGSHSNGSLKLWRPDKNILPLRGQCVFCSLEWKKSCWYPSTSGLWPLPVQTCIKLYWKSNCVSCNWPDMVSGPGCITCWLSPEDAAITIHMLLHIPPLCFCGIQVHARSFRIKWKVNFLEYTLSGAKQLFPVSYSPPAPNAAPHWKIYQAIYQTWLSPRCPHLLVVAVIAFLFFCGRWLIQSGLETTWPLLLLCFSHHLFIYFTPLGLLVFPFMPSLLHSFLNLYPSVLNLSLSFGVPSFIPL